MQRKALQIMPFRQFMFVRTIYAPKERNSLLKRRGYVVLRDEIEFNFADRYGISLLTTHFDEFFDDATQAQYLLEIQYGIGVV